MRDYKTKVLSRSEQCCTIAGQYVKYITHMNKCFVSVLLVVIGPSLNQPRRLTKLTQSTAAQFRSLLSAHPASPDTTSPHPTTPKTLQQIRQSLPKKLRPDINKPILLHKPIKIKPRRNKRQLIRPLEPDRLSIYQLNIPMLIKTKRSQRPIRRDRDVFATAVVGWVDAAW